MLLLADRIFDQLHRLVITVGGHLVTNQMPNSFLGIEFWMIGRKINQNNSLLFLEESPNACPFVPRGSIHIQENSLERFEPVGDVSQERQKTFGVALGAAHQSVPSLKRSHPAKQVEPFVVLTASWNGRLRSSLGPNPSQARVNREPRLVGEQENRFPSLIRHPLEFFLRSRLNLVIPCLVA